MTNLSLLEREKFIKSINELKSSLPIGQDTDYINASLSKFVSKIKSEKYGIKYEEHQEKIDELLETHLPFFKFVKENSTFNGINNNFLIEGDNLAALKALQRTHKKGVDLIYIDPPYNRGENDFIYDDDYVGEEDSFKHSKWLSFMEKRLRESRKLLNNTGVILIHIDENEVFNLVALMNKIYDEKNDLGMIIWNKMNPKGDSKGVSAMHEYVLCYAKNKEEFLKLENTCKRKKPNALKMLNKAKSLYKKIGNYEVPEEVKVVIKPFNYPKELINQFKVKYDLELVNKEFRNWLSRQNFSSGEKAYKFIDEFGEVYRGVSMAWPNKKKAPDDYFIPLIHPITNKPCPVPQRGWRNPPATMEKLLKNNLILFGEDEKKQPEKKYLLREHMLENTPSIYSSAASDDDFFLQNAINFEYAKPIEVLKYFITSVHPKAEVILDFFAGSGSTGHAVMELNEEEDLNRQFILITNNQNNICEEITNKRLKLVIESNNYRENVNYLKTSLLFTKDVFYYDIENILLENIDPVVLLGNATNPELNYLVVKEEELDEVNLLGLDKIYISPDVFLTSKQINELKKNNIEIIKVPDFYYSDLKE